MPKTLHVRAVDDRRYPHPCGLPGRYVARGPLPECAPKPEGEHIADTAEHRNALDHGDLALVQPTDAQQPAADAAKETD